MHATAVDAEKLRELDEDTRRAWETYRDRLHDLAGQEYDEAETAGWDELQQDLERLAQRRRALTAAP